jgi:hypothetical protein
MPIQVHTDSHIEGGQRLSSYIECVVQDTLREFGDQVTRVEVHLNDTNSNQKGGSDDKRCMMEARLGGLPPFAVTATAATLDQAIDAASEKLQKSIQSHIGRLGDKKGRMSAGGAPGV